MVKSYDIVMEERKKLVEKIIENMQNGDIFFKKGWDVSLLRPQNPVSEVMYLGGNRLKLGVEALINDYKDPRWVTFNQATSKGWKVKKGEKGTKCEKWIFTKTVKERNEETGKIEEVEIKLDKPVVNYFTVFNAEQIEGIPPLNLLKTDKEQSFEIAESFIASSECPIKELAQEQAYYSPSEDEIVLPLREAFKSKEAFLRTTLHEMGHSTGHPDRLNRDLSGAFGSKSYAKEELVAELCSIFTQARLNIKLEGEHFNDHTAYIKSWIEVLQNDPSELFRAAAKAETASKRLYDNYLEREKQLIKESVKETELEKEDYIKDLKVQFHWSEYDFGIQDGQEFKGIEAYNFLKRMMEIDKDQRLNQILRDQGQQIRGLYCYKTEISIGYADTMYKSEMRVDLGNLEFGENTKLVSDGLEYRFRLYTDDVLKNPGRYAAYSKYYGNSLSAEDIIKQAEAQIKRETAFLNVIRKREKLLLERTEIKKEKQEYDNYLENEYWRIEYNERSSIDNIKNYKNKILTKELLKEIKELDKKLDTESRGIYKFFFEHIKNGEVIEKGRIDVGLNNSQKDYDYLDKELTRLEKPNSKKIPLFRGFVVAYEYSEKNLGVPDNTTFRGEEAYNFIKKLMKEDIEQNKIQKSDKTYLSISYRGYDTKRIKVRIGDLEFGGKEKVSDGLEYRLKLFPNGVLENKEEWAEKYKVTPEEIEAEAKDMLDRIDKIMVTFREHEKKLEEREQTKVTEKSKAPTEKEKSKRKTRTRTKASKENER